MPSASELLTPIWASNFVGDPSKILAGDWKNGMAAVTFLGGFSKATGSLYITDVIHHHLAIGVLFVFAGHLYRTQYAIGSSFSELLKVHGGAAATSWHLQLAINLAVTGSASIATGHILSAAPAYAYLRYDWPAVLSLFVHHAWIGGFFIVGAAAHAAIYLIQEYQLWSYGVIERVLAHRHSILAHLNWVCIFLGFHSFGLYIHNDTLAALGRTGDLFADGSIALKPVFGLIGQDILVPSAYVSSTIASHSVTLQGTGDFLVHHIHAFTVHVTTLILLKGVLFARSSRLVADKSILGFRFP